MTGKLHILTLTETHWKYCEVTWLITGKIQWSIQVLGLGQKLQSKYKNDRYSTYSFQHILKETHNADETTPCTCNKNLDQFLNRL